MTFNNMVVQFFKRNVFNQQLIFGRFATNNNYSNLEN